MRRRRWRSRRVPRPGPEGSRRAVPRRPARRLRRRRGLGLGTAGTEAPSRAPRPARHGIIRAAGARRAGRSRGSWPCRTAATVAVAGRPSGTRSNRSPGPTCAGTRHAAPSGVRATNTGGSRQQPRGDGAHGNGSDPRKDGSRARGRSVFQREDTDDAPAKCAGPAGDARRQPQPPCLRSQGRHVREARRIRHRCGGLRHHPLVTRHLARDREFAPHPVHHRIHPGHSEDDAPGERPPVIAAADVRQFVQHDQPGLRTRQERDLRARQGDDRTGEPQHGRSVEFGAPRQAWSPARRPGSEPRGQPRLFVRRERDRPPFQAHDPPRHHARPTPARQPPRKPRPSPATRTAGRAAPGARREESTAPPAPAAATEACGDAAPVDAAGQQRPREEPGAEDEGRGPCRVPRGGAGAHAWQAHARRGQRGKRSALAEPRQRPDDSHLHSWR